MNPRWTWHFPHMSMGGSTRPNCAAHKQIIGPSSPCISDLFTSRSVPATLGGALGWSMPFGSGGRAPLRLKGQSCRKGPKSELARRSYYLNSSSLGSGTITHLLLTAHSPSKLSLLIFRFRTVPQTGKLPNVPLREPYPPPPKPSSIRRGQIAPEPVYDINNSIMSWKPPEMDLSWYPPKWNIPPHLLMPGPPPPAPRLPMNEVFSRLKWSVLDPPSDIQVFGPDDKGDLQWRPLFHETNESLLDGAAIVPPTSCLGIVIEPLHYWWPWHDSDTEHLRPAQLLLENPDGQPVSVRQFIEAVHNYTLPLRELLLQCMEIDDPSEQERARFIFRLITKWSDEEISGRPRFKVHLVEDRTGDGDGVECAWIWQDVENRVKIQSASE